MSIHRRILNILANHRARIVSLQTTVKDKDHHAVLDEIIASIEGQMRIADKVAPPPKQSAFPFDGAEVGQYFVVEPDRVDSVRVAASVYGKKHGQRWSVGIRDDRYAIVRRVE